ncbi:MAG: glutathionylspermidine synthase family protein, partial [Planctomycetes bacterium]|nr:glutathionylspermidine synthase family protein [Planctomycetota bacterium]
DAPKMLEYNADTPTALVEAAVAQWMWLKDVDERADQFNSIHEQLIEAWKMILSCKSILPLLYERHPNSPFLLPASFDPIPDGSYVKKPIHAREGSNIELVIGGKVVQTTDGPYKGPCIYQSYAAQLRPHDGRYPVIGSWIVNGESCGMGIREDASMITGNTSRFVPHQFVPG